MVFELALQLLVNESFSSFHVIFMNMISCCYQTVEAVPKHMCNNQVVHYFRTPFLSESSVVELLKQVFFWLMLNTFCTDLQEI